MPDKGMHSATYWFYMLDAVGIHIVDRACKSGVSWFNFETQCCNRLNCVCWGRDQCVNIEGWLLVLGMVLIVSHGHG